MTTAPIAVTMGDPAGIGLECVMKAWQELRQRDDFAFYVIGDPSVYNDVPHASIQEPSMAPNLFAEALPVLPITLEAHAQLGRPDPRNAAAVVQAINAAVEHCQSGQARAMVTAPLSKSVLKTGGNFAFPGHTEYLAHLAGGVNVLMMLASDQLRVIPATIHVALRDVPSLITTELVLQVIAQTQIEMQRKFGLASPRIAVAGLNPHAGEDGHMGTEDRDIIAPAITAAQARGIDVRGPLPADTMFHTRARAGYDVAICMYHDQALIPIKTLDFDTGVNVTLGLPFVRTSPDHGTAIDIAGQGVASPSATIAAIKMAADLSK